MKKIILFAIFWASLLTTGCGRTRYISPARTLIPECKTIPKVKMRGDKAARYQVARLRNQNEAKCAQIHVYNIRTIEFCRKHGCEVLGHR